MGELNMTISVLNDDLLIFVFRLMGDIDFALRNCAYSVKVRWHYTPHFIEHLLVRLARVDS